jgi:hypothetical protein
MQSKLEILEALRTNITHARDSDFITDELTSELIKIEEDINSAIDDEQQIIILEKELKSIELQKRLDNAFAHDDSHTKRLSQ